MLKHLLRGNRWRWAGIGLLVAIGAFGASSLGGTAYAAAGGPITGISSKCLDNKNAALTNNNVIQLYSCSAGSPAQQWAWQGDKMIRTTTNNMCLETLGAATAVGTPVVLYSCSGSDSQAWVTRADGTLLNVKSNLCLTDKNGSTSNGNQIVLGTCGTGSSQKWNISKAVVALPQTQPAAHAAVPAAKKHTAKPTVTVVTTGSPEFGPWLTNVIKPLVEQWYPVIGDYFAYPEYKPATSITLTIDASYQGVARTSGTNIIMSADYYRTHLDDAGSIIHEATHVAQYNPSTGFNSYARWILEGEADYTREHIYNDRAPRAATATETYINGYSPSANLLEYARSHSTLANFVHSVNVAQYKGQYSDAYWKTNTGNSIAQLWTAMTGQAITNPGLLTNGISGKCFDLPNYATADGTRIQIQTCNGSDAEKWIFAGTNGSSTTGVVKGYYGNKCLDAAYSGTTDGTAVWYWNCNYGNAQTWTRQANGSLLNVNANKCLQPVNQANANGTLLELRSCDGSAAQRWTLPSSL